jgi:hypothetical protein
MDQSLVIKRIFSLLLKENEVTLFLIHQNYSILPGELLVAIDLLMNKGWIKLVDYNVSLTQRGKIELYLNRKKYFLSYENFWNDIPEKMKNFDTEENRLLFDKFFLKKLEGKY